MWNNGYGMMGGYGWTGFIIGLIFLIIMGIIIFYLIKKKLIKQNEETPLDVLKKRYAKGEVSKSDFEQIKKDIE